MSFVTADMAVSLDGYVAGPEQGPDKPFGEGPVDDITAWMMDGGAAKNADELAQMNGADAYIMGRNMFGPDRGAFDLEWHGWWGPEPPYQAPVFVLSHHSREPLQVGRTLFTFVDGGIEEALALASAAVGNSGRVDVAGGAATVNQYLRAGLIDELTVHIAPVVLGAGERLFTDVEAIRMHQTSGRVADGVVHITYQLNE